MTAARKRGLMESWNFYGLPLPARVAVIAAALASFTVGLSLIFPWSVPVGPLHAGINIVLLFAALLIVPMTIALVFVRRLRFAIGVMFCLGCTAGFVIASVNLHPELAQCGGSPRCASFTP